MDRGSKVLIVGHNDVIENALLSFLQADGYNEVFSSSALFLDTLNQGKVNAFFEEYRPEYVFLSSVRSGGIAANQNFPAEFIYSNVMSEANIIHESRSCGVKKLLYYASSCVYPRDCAQPIKEDCLLSGSLEKTSEAYSVAKIAGIKMCEAYRNQYGLNAIVAVPATVYGNEGEVNKETAHVMGALIEKFYVGAQEQKAEVSVWGSGSPRREFLHVDDFVSASMALMENDCGYDIVNVGCGEDISISELAQLIASAAGYKGRIVFDKSKPDGVKQKLLDNSRIKNLGWTPRIGLKEGIEKAYQLYR